MSHVDDSRESTDSRADAEQGSEGETGRSVSNLVRAVRRRASPNAVAGAGGGVLLVRGLKTLRGGDVRSGITQSVLGSALVAMAIGKRRSAAGESGAATGEGADVDQRDVVGSAPDLEGVAGESESGSESESVDHAEGDDASAVVDTAPDVEDAATDPEERTTEHASGDEAASVVDTSPDVESATSDDETDDDESAEESDSGWTEVESIGDDGSESDGADDGSGGRSTEADESEGDRTADDTDESEDGEAETADDEAGTADEGDEAADEDGEGADAGDTGVEESADEEGADEESADEEGGDEERAAEESESYDRLGAAAFDEESHSLPAPQRAFNREYLALGAEAVWGIREADDAVLVSQLYDSIEDRDGVQYVASTQIDDERSVTVPDAILDHWDVVAGGGVAVESGDDLVFATSDDLKGDDLLIVVPEEWADETLGDAE